MLSADLSQLQLQQRIQDLYNQMSRLSPGDDDYQNKAIAINDEIMQAEDKLKELQATSSPVRAVNGNGATKPWNTDGLARNANYTPVTPLHIGSKPNHSNSINGISSDGKTGSIQSVAILDDSDSDDRAIRLDSGVGSPRSNPPTTAFRTKSYDGLHTPTTSSTTLVPSNTRFNDTHPSRVSLQSYPQDPSQRNSTTLDHVSSSTMNDFDDDIEILAEGPTSHAPTTTTNYNNIINSPPQRDSTLSMVGIPASTTNGTHDGQIIHQGLPPAPAPVPLVLPNSVSIVGPKKENQSKRNALSREQSSDSISGLKRSYSSLFEKPVTNPATAAAAATIPVKHDPSSNFIDLTDDNANEVETTRGPPEPFRIEWFKEHYLPHILPLYQRVKVEKIILEMIKAYGNSVNTIRKVKRDRLEAKKHVQHLEETLMRTDLTNDQREAYIARLNSNRTSIKVMGHQINDMFRSYDHYKSLLHGLVPGKYVDFRPLEMEFLYKRPRQVPQVVGSEQQPSSLSSTRNILNTISDDQLRGNVDETKQIDSLLKNIEADSDVVDPAALMKTPEGLSVELFDHQKIGLAWLLKMEKSSSAGGILADDMGLGKTIQLISLMLSNPAPDPGPNQRKPPTLIITPVALLQQWEQEIRTKIKPSHHQRVVIYHSSASNKPLKFSELCKYDVVITTYRMVTGEYRSHFNVATHQTKPDTMAERHPRSRRSPFFTNSWYRIILDEAQAIKNPRSLTSVGCYHLESQYRWCLSGTPMQNNVDEFQSLLGFLRIKPYDSPIAFNRDIGSGIRSGQETSMNTFRALLKAVLLRRTKNSKLNGKPILSLPSKTIDTLSAPLGSEESKYYYNLEKGAVTQINKYFHERTLGQNYTNVLSLLLRLRQACCHPKLIAYSSLSSAATQAMMDREKKALPSLRSLSAEAINQIMSNSEKFVCPKCLDPITPGNTLLYLPCGHHICTECNGTLFDSSTNSDGPGGTNTVDCPSCSNRILVFNVCSYDTFNKVFMSGLSDQEIMDRWKMAIREESNRRRTRRRDFNLQRQQRLEDSMFKDELALLTNDDVVGNDESAVSVDSKDVQGMLVPAQDADMDHKLGIMVTTDENTQENEEIKATTEEGRSDDVSQDAYDEACKLVGLEKLFPNGWLSSSKIDHCVQKIMDILREFPGEKIILFSQFTSMLTFLEVPLMARNIDYLRYDGTMDAMSRNETVTAFFETTTPVMLISLKAGSVGLTLTCASHVLIVDPCWNPYSEEQAMDRVHRIGQIRPVFVHRILTPDSVEDRIVALQNQKKELIDSALDENGLRSISRLSFDDIRFLFSGRRGGGGSGVSASTSGPTNASTPG